MYGIQFYFEFNQAIRVQESDPLPRFRARFWRLGFTGTPVEVLPGGDPVSIKYENVSEIATPLIKSEVTVNLVAQDYWSVDDLYVTDEYQVKLTIDVDEDPTDTTSLGHGFWPLWTGWVRASELNEDYAAKPYPVQVQAWDGLKSLGDIPLIKSDDTRLAGRVSLLQALRTALPLTKLDLPLVTGVNIFNNSDVANGQHTGGLVQPIRDPLYRTAVNAETFTSDNGEVFTGDKTIEALSEPFALRTAQAKGRWYSLRTPEMAGGWDVWNTESDKTIHIRNHSSPDTFAPATSEGSLDLNVVVATTWQVAANEGSVYKQGIAPSVRIEQTFGRFVNKLPNGDFSDYDSNGFPIGWIKNNVPASGPQRPHVVGTGTETDPQGLYIFGAGDNEFNKDTPYVGIRMLYAPGAVERTKKLKRTLKGRFKLNNVRAAKIVVIAQREPKPLAKEAHLLKEGGSWVLDPKKKESKGILIYHSGRNANGIIKAKGGYADINLPMDAIDNLTQLWVYLCAGEALDQPDAGVTPYVIYENIRMEVEVDTNNLDGTQRTIAKPGKKASTDLTLTLGDVPDPAFPSDRIGTLFNATGAPSQGTPTTVWYKGNEVTTSAGPPAGAGKTLLDIRTEDLARQTMQPAWTFEGTLIGRLPYAVQTVLRFADMGKLVNDVLEPFPFLITGLETSLRMCSNKVTAVQYMQEELVDAPPIKREWQTPDGTLPIDTDETTGLPTDPTLPVRINTLDKAIAIIEAGNGLNPAIPLPGRPGWTPLLINEPKLSLTVKKNGIVKGRFTSALRKLFDAFNLP